MEEKENKKIVVVSGDGTELDISEVHNHLNVEKPNSDTPNKDKIVIPTKKQ